MSATVEGVDARGYLAGWLEALTGMMVSDIQAIPDDKWTTGFGGCSKGGNALVGDTVTNLRWTTATLKNEDSDVYNNMAGVIEETSTKAGAIAALTEASAEFTAALKAASDEHLNSVKMAPWQMPMPVFILANVSVSHVWYHDGQLNYIQTLLGDDQVHWMAPGP
ncbi:MAG TPA: hypothetical protein VG944_09930 [Fimbriimonas sp.]|nr:hypothetical protein [Fimbriimonas sp.]